MSFPAPAGPSSSLLLSMESQLVSLYVERDELRRALGVSDAAEVVALVEELRESITRHRIGAEEARAVVERERASNAQHAEVVAELRKRVASLEPMRTRIAALEQEASTRSAQIDALRSAAGEVGPLRTAFAELERTATERSSELESLRGQVAEIEWLRGQVAELEDVRSALGERTAELAAARSREVADGERLAEEQHRREAAEHEARDLRGQLDVTELELAVSRSDREVLAGEHERVQAELVRALAELDHVHEELVVTRAERDALADAAAVVPFPMPAAPGGVGVQMVALVTHLNDLLQSVPVEPVALDGVDDDIAEPVRRLEKRISSVVHLVDSVSGLLMKERA